MDLSLKKISFMAGPHVVRIAIALVCALGAASAYIFAFYYIQSESAKAVQDEASATSDRLKSQRLDSLSRVLTVRGADVAKLDNYLVTPGSEVTLIEKMETLATHAGVQVDISQAKEGANSLSFTFTTTGSYADTRYFLALLEALPINISFGNTTLTNDTSSGKSVWNGSYSIQILSFMK